MWVDPRACGAASGTLRSRSGRRGRSPRMRGSRGLPTVVAMRAGSIPAHAGQPSRPSATGGAGRVDPRACGAAASVLKRTRVAPGRSPRMRGSRFRADHPALGDGSIPAHAGQPGMPATRERSGRVDPRACGAARGPCADLLTTPGRSPRMRGSRVLSIRITDASGSIPAHAGQPRPQRGSRCWRRVDPRACGAADCPGIVTASRSGRSPRMRGSRKRRRRGRRPMGSIPAHAGQPGLPRAW